MATEEQLMTALQAADAAGDEFSAGHLAAMIKESRAQAASWRPPPGAAAVGPGPANAQPADINAGTAGTTGELRAAASRAVPAGLLDRYANWREGDPNTGGMPGLGTYRNRLAEREHPLAATLGGVVQTLGATGKNALIRALKLAGITGVDTLGRTGDPGQALAAGAQAGLLGGAADVGLSRAFPAAGALPDVIPSAFRKPANILALRGVGVTPSDVALLRSRFGSPQVAGAEALNLEAPGVGSAFPTFASPETRLSNVKSIEDIYGPMLQDARERAGNVDLDKVNAQLTALQGQVSGDPAERVLAAGKNARGLQSLIARFRAQFSSDPEVVGWTRRAQAAEAGQAKGIYDRPHMETPQPALQRDPAALQAAHAETSDLRNAGTFSGTPVSVPFPKPFVPSESFPASTPPGVPPGESVIRMGAPRQVGEEYGSQNATMRPAPGSGYSPVLQDHQMPATVAAKFKKWLDDEVYHTAVTKAGGDARVTRQIMQSPELRQKLAVANIFRQADEEAVSKALPPEDFQAFLHAKDQYSKARTFGPIVQHAADVAASPGGYIGAQSLREMLTPRALQTYGNPALARAFEALAKGSEALRAPGPAMAAGQEVPSALVRALMLSKENGR